MIETNGADLHTAGKDCSAPIGVFDSGIGGLTVARAILDDLPQERLIYFGDTARVPYGNKSSETVQRYCREITSFFRDLGVKMVVVACNTSTASAWDTITEIFPGPVVGVVEPGAMAAVTATKTGKIGVIGTKSTIASGAYDRAIKRLDPSVQVWSTPCPLFVPLTEEGWVDDRVTQMIAERYLGSLMAEGVDVIILGCTHYPLLQNTIQGVVGPQITLVNSAAETAKAVALELSRHGLLSPGSREPSDFCSSDDIEGFRRHFRTIVGAIEARFHLLTDFENPPACLAARKEAKAAR
ncbi:MAG TPA: glutamate racemase [bacterium]|nr:glutamate racemase [bacterium]HPO09292.1 glutamate racemase [bacterium]HQO34599.1 glutamate racemase [bacterium]HQP98409.1 glutamate racemase [bacterium]